MTGKGVKRSKIPGREANIPGRGVMREVERKIKAGGETIRAGSDF